MTCFRELCGPCHCMGHFMHLFFHGFHDLAMVQGQVIDKRWPQLLNPQSNMSLLRLQRLIHPSRRRRAPVAEWTVAGIWWQLWSFCKTWWWWGPEKSFLWFSNKYIQVFQVFRRCCFFWLGLSLRVNLNGCLCRTAGCCLLGWCIQIWWSILVLSPESQHQPCYQRKLSWKHLKHVLYCFQDGCLE